MCIGPTSTATIVDEGPDLDGGQLKAGGHGAAETSKALATPGYFALRDLPQIGGVDHLKNENLLVPQIPTTLKR